MILETKESEKNWLYNVSETADYNTKY